jgi:hypothetical protein
MYHFTLKNTVVKMTSNEAIKKMDQISPQWEDESTEFGELNMGVYDWDFSDDEKGIQLNIPKLRTGGEIQKNEKASNFFGFDIFGDCFLEENEKGLKKMSSLIS